MNVPCVDATEARRAEGESRVAESSERADGRSESKSSRVDASQHRQRGAIRMGRRVEMGMAVVAWCFVLRTAV